MAQSGGICAMYNQSARPQVQYTLDTLSSTLYQLMESQPFSEITVTALCRAAGVGRRSYYHNCDTAEDLVIYRIRKKVRENLSQVDFRCEDAPKLYRLFFEYWSDQQDFLRITFREGFSVLFFQEFTEACNQSMDYRLLAEFLEGRQEQHTLRLFHNAFLVGGLCNILSFWIQEDFSTPVDLLVDIMLSRKPVV